MRSRTLAVISSSAVTAPRGHCGVSPSAVICVVCVVLELVKEPLHCIGSPVDSVSSVCCRTFCLRAACLRRNATFFDLRVWVVPSRVNCEVDARKSSIITAQTPKSQRHSPPRLLDSVEPSSVDSRNLTVLPYLMVALLQACQRTPT